MKIGKKISSIFISVIALAIIFLSVSFMEKREVGYRMDDISVKIENRFENFFVDEDDVMSLIMQNEGDSILGDQFGHISLKDIERRIESHSFVKEAEVFRDLKGHLVVKAYQSKPVARLIANNGRNAYISEEGLVLPVSSKYTARVVVLSGQYMNQMTQAKSIEENEYYSKIFELVNFINEDSFWKMQIAEVNIDKNGKVVMYPQIGSQKLEFGKIEDVESKFNRLKMFFKRIMPTKGWNAYERVNVEFKNQIICE